MVASGPVGQTVGGAPALITLDGVGHLLAFVRDEGGTQQIGVHRVAIDGSTLAATVTEDVYVEDCDGECGDVSLVARTVGDGYEVALAYRDGTCGGSAAAVLRRLAVDAAGTVTTVGGVLTTEPIQGLRHPIAHARTSPDEWILAWTFNAGAERGLAVRRWSIDGTPLGTEPLVVDGTAGVGTADPIALAAGTGADGYRLFALDLGSDAFVRAGAACVTEEE